MLKMIFTYSISVSSEYKMYRAIPVVVHEAARVLEPAPVRILQLEDTTYAFWDQQLLCVHQFAFSQFPEQKISMEILRARPS
jgi:hypothetical protein